MRSIIFTVGLPGSGKTTLAKALSNMFGYFHFEFDLYAMDKNHYKNTHENDKIIIVDEISKYINFDLIVIEDF